MDVPHEYGPSQVGHGEAQCKWCLGTNRENAVIAPNHCDERAQRDPQFCHGTSKEQVTLRMDAYYYGFGSTGVYEIDKILSAVACAGKAYHGTDQWTEDTDPYPGHTGSSPVDWIWNAAKEAADTWRARYVPEIHDAARSGAMASPLPGSTPGCGPVEIGAARETEAEQRPADGSRQHSTGDAGNTERGSPHRYAGGSVGAPETTCEGSGDPANCPENEGRGCCRPNPEKPVAWRKLINSAYETHPRWGYSEDEIHGGEPLYAHPAEKTTEPRYQTICGTCGEEHRLNQYYNHSFNPSGEERAKADLERGIREGKT